MPTYNNKMLMNDYRKDQIKTQHEAGVAVFLMVCLLATGIVSLFTMRTSAQPEGQLASGVTECVSICINR